MQTISSILRVLPIVSILVLSSSNLKSDSAAAESGERISNETLICEINLQKWLADTFKISADLRRVAFVVRDDDKYYIQVNDRQGEKFEGIGSPGPIFSPNGERIAYIAFEADKSFLVLDEIPGKKYEGVGLPAFSPDSKRVAYIAVEKGMSFLVLDGVESEKRYSGGNKPIFSPDSKRIAFMAYQEQSDMQFVVLDGKELEKYWGIKDYLFSPNSARLVFIAIKVIGSDTTQSVVIDGKESKAYDNIYEDLVFSPNSEDVYYTAKTNGKLFVIRNEEELGEYENIGKQGIIISPDNRRLAFVTAHGDKQNVVVDGQEQKPYDGVSGPAFSPDSRHIAYVAKAGKQGFVVLDGVEQEKYDGVGGLKFGNTGRLAYVAFLTGKQFVVSDGIAYGQHNTIGSTGVHFSPDDGIVGYVVLDSSSAAVAINDQSGEEQPGIVTRETPEIVFDSVNAWHYLVGKKYTPEVSPNVLPGLRKESYGIFLVEERFK